MQFRWIVILAALAALSGAAGSAPSRSISGNPADSALGTQLDDIDRRAGQIQDLTARFEQQKFTALLKKPLVSSGRVRVKGAVVRWDTETPEPAVLHSDGREIRMYYPRQRVVEVYPIDQRITDLAASPLPRLTALRQHFRIERGDLKDAAGTDTGAGPASSELVALRLAPTDEFLKEHVEQVLVVLDARTACVVSVRVDDADGDRTVIRFSDLKLDAGLKDADVALAVPSGTKVSRPLEGVQGDSGTPRRREAGRGRPSRGRSK